MKKYLFIAMASVFMWVGCGLTGGDEPPILPDGHIPSSFLGTWISDYNFTKAIFTIEAIGAQYEYTYADENEFRGGIDVDEVEETIKYAETYYWDGAEWVYDEDPYLVKSTYLLVSDSTHDSMYTDAFDMDMEVYKRTAGSGDTLNGTWVYVSKRWYGSESNPTYVEERKTVLTLNGNDIAGTYTRKKYINDEEVDSNSGNYTYGDVNPDELYLDATADIMNAWVIEDDYLVTGPRYYTQSEIALIKQ